MKFFTTPNSKNIIVTFCIVVIEISQLTFFPCQFQKHKKETKKKTKTKKQHKTHDNGNQKYPIIISNYHLRYPVTSYFTVFQYVIITDNLQNLRFYQRFSKNSNDNMMFCTKNKLLTRKTAHTISLLQFFYQCRLL